MAVLRTTLRFVFGITLLVMVARFNGAMAQDAAAPDSSSNSTTAQDEPSACAFPFTADDGQQYYRCVDVNGALACKTSSQQWLNCSSRSVLLLMVAHFPIETNDQAALTAAQIKYEDAIRAQSPRNILGVVSQAYMVGDKIDAAPFTIAFDTVVSFYHDSPGTVAPALMTALTADPATVFSAAGIGSPHLHNLHFEPLASPQVISESTGFGSTATTAASRYHHPSGGAVAAAVIGIMALVLLLSAGVWCVVRRMRRNRRETGTYSGSASKYAAYSDSAAPSAGMGRATEMSSGASRTPAGYVDTPL